MSLNPELEAYKWSLVIARQEAEFQARKLGESIQGLLDLERQYYESTD